MRYAVKYDKVFLSGNLKGMQIECGFRCSDPVSQEYSLRILNHKAQIKHIDRDYGTNDKHYICNVRAIIEYER